jgi:hypothetical protein
MNTNTGEIAIQLAYLCCIFGVSVVLCGVAVLLIWRYANLRSVVAACVIYAIVAVLLWHGLQRIP